MIHGPLSTQEARSGWSQPKLTEFDASDAATVSSPGCAPNGGTCAFSNNDSGEIVGYYTDANVVPHAFIRKADGRFISFDAPGAG